MVNGTAHHYVAGSDRPIPSPAVYGEPSERRKTISIDWDKIAAEQPQVRLCADCLDVEIPLDHARCPDCALAAETAARHEQLLDESADLIRRLARIVKASRRHPDTFEAAGQILSWAEILDDLLPEGAVAPSATGPRKRISRPTSTTSTRATQPRSTRVPLPQRPEFIAACRAAYVDDQLNIVETAERLKSSALTVRTALENGGVQLRQHPRKNVRLNIDEAFVVAEYMAGKTVPQIARENGWGVRTLRKRFEALDVPKRDDRHTHSGGANRAQDPPGLVDGVRRLYLDELLSQDQVAIRLGVSRKAVTRIMRTHGIPARQGQSGGGDTLGNFRARLEQLGVTSAEIRNWARDNGHEVGVRGVVPGHIVDAYADAHSTA